MTAAAFEQTVTDEINAKLLEIYTPDDVAATIAKAPARAQYRELMQVSELYYEQAARHQGEADRLRQLASQSKEQAENLKRQANL
jgi:hypothetical protein